MTNAQPIFDQIADSLEIGNAQGVKDLTEKAIAQDIKAEAILNQGLVAGMNRVGDKFKKNEIFIPEVLIAARAMKSGMEIIKPLLAKANVKSRGKVVIGTVKGDLHDIGKNIVSMMLEGSGFDVVNMGADVSIDQILEHVRTSKPDVVGLSALLTTTMMVMKDVVDALEKNNLRKGVKVIVGGAPITQAYADEIRADGYAPDAASSVDLVRKLLGLRN